MGFAVNPSFVDFDFDYASDSDDQEIQVFPTNTSIPRPSTEPERQAQPLTPERVKQNITPEAVDVRSLFHMPPEVQKEVYRRLNVDEAFNLAKTLFYSKIDPSMAFLQMLGHHDLVPFLERKPHRLPGRVLNVISSVIRITKIPIKVLKLHGLFEPEKRSMSLLSQIKNGPLVEKFRSLLSRIKKGPSNDCQIDTLAGFFMRNRGFLSQLEILDITNLTAEYSMDLQFLPKSVTHLNISGTLGKAIVENLPPNLTYLDMSYSDVNVEEIELPQSIVNLDVGCSLNHHHLTAKFIKKLPRDLEDLNLSTLQHRDFSEIDYQSEKKYHSLKNSIFNLSPADRKELFPELPRHLTSLNLLCDSVEPENSLTCEEAGLLPRSLTSLKLKVARTIWKKKIDEDGDEDIVQALPRSLKELVFLNVFRPYEDISIRVVRALSSNLDSLVLMTLDKESAALLPRNLRYLEVGLMISDAVTELPPYLQELHVECEYTELDETIAALPKELLKFSMYSRRQRNPNDFSRLPPKLRSFKVLNGSCRGRPDYDNLVSATFSCSSISVLPPTLTELYLFENFRLDTTKLRYLLPQIQVLGVGGFSGSIDLINECIPKNLKTIALPGIDEEGQAVKPWLSALKKAGIHILNDKSNYFKRGNYF